MVGKARIKAYYDRLGSLLDSQVFYEKAALEELAQNCAMEKGQAVFELGCGTGRFARHLLKSGLPSSATYYAVDLSGTMVELARKKLRPWGERATVVQTQGETSYPLPDGSVDRFVSTYVLDLMEEEELQAQLSEAHRLLRSGGLLGLASLTYGDTLVSRLVTRLWAKIHGLNPLLVGGCRPIRLLPRLSPGHWKPVHHRVVRAFGVPSEVVVAERLAH